MREKTTPETAAKKILSLEYDVVPRTGEGEWGMGSFFDTENWMMKGVMLILSCYISWIWLVCLFKFFSKWVLLYTENWTKKGIMFILSRHISWREVFCLTWLFQQMSSLLCRKLSKKGMLLILSRYISWRVLFCLSLLKVGVGHVYKIYIGLKTNCHPK